MQKYVEMISSIFWTVWVEFNPHDEEHLSSTDIKLIEAAGLKGEYLKNR